MTDEELKKKCTERAKIFQQAMESCHSSSPIDCIEWFADRIAELEHQLTHRNCLDCSNHSSNLRMRNLDLEKENAELKGIKDVATLIRANNDTVTTLMQLNNMLVSKTQQLTKAKEIIKDLLGSENTSCEEEMFFEIRKKAEQFLSEVEK